MSAAFQQQTKTNLTKAASRECGGTSRTSLHLQRRAASSVRPLTAPPIVEDVLRSSGQPLDGVTREFMEPRFGHDFSRVRVHTDLKAAESARQVNALAFTVGQNIVFGAGQFETGTLTGRELIAHELAHTIQQPADSSHSGAPLEISSPHDPSEYTAHESAHALMSEQTPGTISNAPMKLARQISSAPPKATEADKGAGGPVVELVPDKTSGRIAVVVDHLKVYDIGLPNAQGGAKAESQWDSAKQELKLTITVTPGATVTQADVLELGKRFPNVSITITSLSLPNGLPVLVKEREFAQRPPSATDIELGRRWIPLMPGTTLNESRLPPAQTSTPTAAEPEAQSEEAEPGGLWESVGEWVHGGLDVVGFIPGIGEIADGINAVIYLAEGRYAEASISAVAMIPIIGDAGKVGKWTVKGAKEIVERGAKKGAEELTEGLIKRGGEELAEKAAKEGGEHLAEKSGKELAETKAAKEAQEQTKSSAKKTAKEEEEAAAKKSEKDPKLAAMRFQVQWGMNEGGPTFGLPAVAPWNTGVSVAEALIVLSGVMALVTPTKARLAALPAYQQQVKWISERPPAGVGTLVKKSKYFRYQNYTDARVDVENLRGDNLRR